MEEPVTQVFGVEIFNPCSKGRQSVEVNLNCLHFCLVFQVFLSFGLFGKVPVIFFCFQTMHFRVPVAFLDYHINTSDCAYLCEESINEMLASFW